MSEAISKRDPKQDSSTKMETGQKTATTPDFRRLRDEVWVEVFKFLTVKERSILSQTCKRLHAIFNSPPVWTSVYLKVNACLAPSQPPSAASRRLKMIGRLSRGQHALLYKFGGSIQNVTLQTADFYLIFSSYSSLLSLGDGKAMKSFTIKFIHDSGQNASIFQKLGKDVHDNTSLHTLLSHACSQWPECTVQIDVYSDSTAAHALSSDVLACSPSDVRCKNLRTLTINDSDYTEVWLRSLLDPGKPIPTCDLVSRFPSLQHLALSDFLVTDQLLYTLARNPGPLCTLTVQFDFSGKEVTDVSSAAWSQLVEACPQVRVCCFFRSFRNVERILKPEAPLVEIKIRSDCQNEIPAQRLKTFCLNHHHTLQKLDYTIYTMSLMTRPCQPEDLPLVAIVMGCPQLVHLHYGGLLRWHDVIKLAERGDRRWKGVVLDGRYIVGKVGTMLGGRQPLPQDHRDLLEQLSAVMSRCLGFSWKFYGL